VLYVYSGPGLERNFVILGLNVRSVEGGD